MYSFIQLRRLHPNLIKMLISYGYSEEMHEDGVCHGFCGMAMQAFLTDNFDTFQAKCLTINQAESFAQTPEPSTHLNDYAFLDGVSLYLQSSEYLNTPFNDREKFVFSLIKETKAPESDHSIRTFCKRTFRYWLRGLIDSTQESPPLAMILSANKHSIFLGIDSKKIILADVNHGLIVLDRNQLSNKKLKKLSRHLFLFLFEAQELIHVEIELFSLTKIPDNILSLFEKNDFDIKFKNSNGACALTLAVTREDQELVEFIINQGASLDITPLPHNDTLLIFSSTKNTPKITRCLLKAGADIHQKNDSDESPLYMACLMNSHETLREIIDFFIQNPSMVDYEDYNKAIELVSLEGRDKKTRNILFEGLKQILAAEKMETEPPALTFSRSNSNQSLEDSFVIIPENLQVGIDAGIQDNTEMLTFSKLKCTIL